jgi:hypothetical protein
MVSIYTDCPLNKQFHILSGNALHNLSSKWTIPHYVRYRFTPDRKINE